jgi:hypothetical protein
MRAGGVEQGLGWGWVVATAEQQSWVVVGKLAVAHSAPSPL